MQLQRRKAFLDDAACRKRLIRYRESVLRPVYPTVLPERGPLRHSMMSELLAWYPTHEAAFHALIPRRLVIGTAPGMLRPSCRMSSGSSRGP
jgi:hypothetical protein